MSAPVPFPDATDWWGMPWGSDFLRRRGVDGSALGRYSYAPKIFAASSRAGLPCRPGLGFVPRCSYIAFIVEKRCFDHCRGMVPPCASRTYLTSVSSLHASGSIPCSAAQLTKTSHALRRWFSVLGLILSPSTLRAWSVRSSASIACFFVVIASGLMPLSDEYLMGGC